MASILPSEKTANVSAHPICLHPEQNSNKPYNARSASSAGQNVPKCTEIHNKAATVTTATTGLGHEVKI